MAATNRQPLPIREPVERHGGPTPYTALLLGSKWTIPIIQLLVPGGRRFNQLHAHLGPISPRTLAERLRWLEREGILTRTAYPEIPPRVEYALTAKGRGLEPTLRAIMEYEQQWGDR